VVPVSRRERFDPFTAPDDLWTGTDVQEALANRQMGRFFALYMTATTASQTDIANCVGRTQPQISRIMASAHRVQTLDFLTDIADGLALPDRARLLMGLAPAAMSVAVAVAGASQSQCPHPCASQPREKPVKTLAPTSASSGNVEPSGPAWEDAVADKSVWFAMRARKMTMDPVILEQFEDDLRRVAWEYLYAPRQREHFGELVLLRDNVFRQIENGRQRPDQARRLYGLAGISCALLAQTSHELGFRRAGMSHAHAAFVCAELADYNGLRVWIRATQAAIAEYSGLPREAVRYAEAGQQNASAGTAVIRCLSLAANGHARLGNRAEAEEALSAARRARETAGEHDPLDQMGGVFHVSLGKQHAYAASAYALLGDGSAADREATTALELYQAAPPEQRQPISEGYAYIDVAFARLLVGELDGVAAALDPVFALPGPTRVDLFGDKCRRLHHYLGQSPYEGSSGADDLRERLESFVATVGAEALA
jgi:hypothetical protein